MIGLSQKDVSALKYTVDLSESCRSVQKTFTATYFSLLVHIAQPCLESHQ